ncbi:kinase-like protein [Aulographum hederae CBS 113979]|uniref:Kinase-like protein n=1 Tax=Aulographum hederae CBS 113979 TaxID=1176131 RepID=A0A6G1GMJ5_9PEZI|nr:kinase-like protein [Aulographum hederae CBS 113979]
MNACGRNKSTNHNTLLALMIPTLPPTPMEPTQIPLNAADFDSSYKFVKKVGIGVCGLAKLYKNHHNGHLLVVKRVYADCHTLSLTDSKGFPNKVPMEAEIMRLLPQHSRIMPLHFCTPQFPNGDFGLIMPYCDLGICGLLLDAIGNPQSGTPKTTREAALWHVILQVTESLAFLHHGRGAQRRDWNPVSHRDIKEDNILMRTSSPPGSPFPDLVIADFGMSAMYDNHVSGKVILADEDHATTIEESPKSDWRAFGRMLERRVGSSLECSDGLSLGRLRDVNLDGARELELVQLSNGLLRMCIADMLCHEEKLFLREEEAERVIGLAGKMVEVLRGQPDFVPMPRGEFQGLGLAVERDLKSYL